jgi:hypothetical protein
MTCNFPTNGSKGRHVLEKAFNTLKQNRSDKNLFFHSTRATKSVTQYAKEISKG